MLQNQSNITNFVLDIPDSGLTKSFQLNVQSATLPGIRIPVTDTVSAPKGLGRAQLPGSTLEFDPVMIRFIVDENLESWLEMYQWMLTYNNYLTSENTAWGPGGTPEAVLLHILDNEKKNIVLTFILKSGWCSALSEIEYDYSQDGDPIVVCNATINYKYFEIEKDGRIITGRPSINANKASAPGVHPSMRQQ
ncbi:hypothetical protein fHeYen901_170 [Yersinia phage fHe-Yen9-01]|uniref:Tail completion protein n=1 Tax=Yersinia phage fHe-Yen9-01 TaxID=1965363 RepID=A0A1V0DXQ8_9CAUD|nr:hypothetical protein KNT60_gp169 [Yersinia phage fHe-Yen9-01]ARB05943.1 hypothetical protein fHeYen901_170 [Yersinia phage fHe-Yen9-01]